ncbi:hypothetical protein Emag_003835 [Eimeria magna]
MACCLCGPSGGGCCCGGCGGYDQAEVLRQQQRQRLLEAVRKMKGLSRNSRAHLSLDPLVVVEDARARMHAKEASVCCLSKPRSWTWPLLLWLCIYGAALSSLQLKLIDLRPVVPSWMLESDTRNEFTRFFSWAVFLMMAVMSAAFVAAALRVCNFISFMTAEVVAAAQEELRLDISESMDHDFHAFVQRLREHFITSEDFTMAAIKGAHRRLHCLLKSRIGLVGVYVQGPSAVGREVETAVAPLRCCMLFFLFFLPWIFTMLVNFTQLYLFLNVSTAAPADPLAPPEEVELGLSPEREAAESLEKEAAITRTWEEAVVFELIELLEGPRMTFERYSEEGLNNRLFSRGEDDQYPHPLEAAPSSFDQQQQQQQQQQRLLTGDSCGGLPTAYQAALQAPCLPPRSKSRSQCLALAPSSLWHDVEIGLRRLSGLEEEYIELETLHDLLPLDNQQPTFFESEAQEKIDSPAMPTSTTATAQPAAAAAAGETEEALSEVSPLKAEGAEPSNNQETEERMHDNSSESSS